MDDKRLNATKRHLRMIRANFKEVREVTLPSGAKEEVVVFSGKKPLFMGQCTWANTIIVHELVFRREKLLNYVMIHETTHQGQRYSLYVLGGIFVLATVLAILTDNFGVGVSVAVFLCLLFSWFIEFQADCHTIRELGMPAVREAMADKRDLFKFSLASFIIKWLTRPHILLTYRICRRLHQEVD